MVCKGTWSRFDLVSLKVFKYVLFHLVFRGYRGQIVMASTQLGIFFFFFIKHAHSQCLRANSYILVSWLLVLNGIPDLIKTNLFFFFSISLRL